jgi:hypothetical protein
MLVGAGPSPDLPPHVPIGGVEQSHGGTSAAMGAIVGPGTDRFG